VSGNTTDSRYSYPGADTSGSLLLQNYLILKLSKSSTSHTTTATMPTCPECQHNWEPEVIDLTSEKPEVIDLTQGDANNPREILVLDAQQSNDRRGEQSSNVTTIEPAGPVHRIPERGWGIGDLPSAGIRRVQFEDNFEPGEEANLNEGAYRTPQRERSAGTRVLYERGWAPRRAMGIRRIFRVGTTYQRRTYRPQYNTGTY